MIDDVIYTPLEVTHSPGTFGVLMNTGHSVTAYIPDTGPLPTATLKTIKGVDTFILGASFWGTNRLPEDHLSVEEALATAREVDAERFYLTHLSMHYDSPVTHRELESSYPLPAARSGSLWTGFPYRLPRESRHEQQREPETRSLSNKEVLLFLLPPELRCVGVRERRQSARDRRRP